MPFSACATSPENGRSVVAVTDCTQDQTPGPTIDPLSNHSQAAGKGGGQGGRSAALIWPLRRRDISGQIGTFVLFVPFGGGA
jgi:hypothetical protein